uniref:6,7-dimethyl-8-ribityllumazine synthase n=1 Tax=Kalanchoe fedtschenkoi TaxID=63787 RepID=A0A7N0VJ94_KALFE
MGNTLRCCLACVLPCGALDLIRIVHLNGYVEEITRSITAGEILRANPNHVLSKPSSQGVVRRILILSPETELKRGGIYFLIPESSLPENKRRKASIRSNQRSTKKIICSSTSATYSQQLDDLNGAVIRSMPHDTAASVRKSYRKEHHRSRKSAEVWRPHLDSIFED